MSCTRLHNITTIDVNRNYEDQLSTTAINIARTMTETTASTATIHNHQHMRPKFECKHCADEHSSEQHDSNERQPSEKSTLSSVDNNRSHDELHHHSETSTASSLITMIDDDDVDEDSTAACCSSQLASSLHSFADSNKHDDDDDDGVADVWTATEAESTKCRQSCDTRSVMMISRSHNGDAIRNGLTCLSSSTSSMCGSHNKTFNDDDDEDHHRSCHVVQGRQNVENNDATMAAISDEHHSSHTSGVPSESRRTETKSFSAIPGPWPSLPFIGTGWQYFAFVGRYDINKLHEAHIDRYRTYGSIVREEYQWGKSIVHIYDPADFEIVLRSQGACPVRPPNEFVSHLRASKPHMYPNVGFANLNGVEWLNLRKKLAPAIMRLRTITEVMCEQNEVCDDFLEYLWQIRDSETDIVANLQDATYRLALESICMMCLDSRIGSFPRFADCNDDHMPDDEPADGDALIEATKMMFDSFNKLYYGLPFWKYMPTAAYNNLDKAETTIYEIASKYIDAAIDEQQTRFDSGASVLKTLLADKSLSKEEVKVTVIDFIIGGIFSVSNSLVYLFYHLAANPAVQETLYQEIISILGDEYKSNQSGDQSIELAHLAKMSYLKACVSESFRLNCPVPGIMRVTTEPIALSGYQIPANTPVFSHCMTTCRLEEYFENAHRYHPERWLDKSQSHPFALIPFGYGSRICVGKRFSENEIYLATVRLISAYRLELAPGCEELELKHAFMVIPAKAISMRITRR